MSRPRYEHFIIDMCHCQNKQAEKDGSLSPNSITSIYGGFVAQQVVQQIHNNLTLFHSRRRLAIEPRATYI